MSEVGQRRAMRTAPPVMIDEGFARKFVELSHGLSRACRLDLGRMMGAMQVEMRLLAGAY